MPKIVDVNDALVKRIEVSRLNEDNGGYQRKLQTHRIPIISDECSKEGAVVPPIIVAKLGDKMEVIDGQHRLEAWKLSQFPLQACIYDVKDKKDAAQAFVKINSKQVRVSREHILTISDDSWSKMCRKLAKKYDVKVTVAHAALSGAISQGGAYRREDVEPTDRGTEIAERVLAAWTRDKRFGDEDNGIFSLSGTIMMVARFLREEHEDKNWDSLIKKFLSLRYTRDTALYASYGTGLFRQKIMQQEAEKLLHL